MSTCGCSTWTIPRNPRRWRATPFNEGQAAFSPDDRWVAYASTESGVLELFIGSSRVVTIGAVLLPQD